MRRLPIRNKTLGTIDCLLSDEDFDRVSQHRWYVFRRRKALYIRGIIEGRSILIHRFIMGCPDDQTVDHIDGDPLNNTRQNLRVCSVGENVSHAWKRGGYAAHQETFSRKNVVRKKLADGSIKTFVYDRADHKPRKKSQTNAQTVAFKAEKCDSQKTQTPKKKRSETSDLGSVVGDVGLEPTTR